MRVLDIMHPDVITVAPTDTFITAARVLREHDVSAVVIDGGEGPVGIVTERDYVRLVDEGRNPESTTCESGMTANLITIEEHNLYWRELRNTYAGGLAALVASLDPPPAADKTPI